MSILDWALIAAVWVGGGYVSWYMAAMAHGESVRRRGGR